MTKRRPVRINIELPELTAAQADFLWNFLEDLAFALWEAYENELIHPQHSFSPEAHDSAVDEYEAYLERRSTPCEPVTDQDPDPLI